MKRPKLTKKQTILLEYIESFIVDNGFSPSYREIASGMNYKSLATVSEHIDNLIAKNYLRKVDNSARSLELVSDYQQKTIELIDQIKIRYKQLDELEKTKVNQAFKILNIDKLNELI